MNHLSHQIVLRIAILGTATLLLSLQLFLFSNVPTPVVSIASHHQASSSEIGETKHAAVRVLPRRNVTLVQPVEIVVDGVTMRPFAAWPENRPLPCFLSNEKGKGLFFMKLMKTGGSTAAGIHVRIAKHLSKREHSTLESTRGTLCQGKWEHDWAYNMLKDRVREHSFTWTLLREPTKRVVSQFFHFEVTRKGTATTDESFQSYLREEYLTRDALYQYYLRTLSLKRQPRKIPVGKIPSTVQQVLNDYDFIGITERMDESAVVLMMLLNLRLADILFLDAKSSGGYDDGGGDRKCHLIQKSTVSEGMNQYFAKPSWQRIVGPDKMLYTAANKALDLTIDQLGRNEFEEKLTLFRRAQTIARNRCIQREVFPCTSKGAVNPNKNCLWKDSGCGSDCLDEIATELDLW